jgi:alpha-beta hydrolase superfamily lysophospholipase
MKSELIKFGTKDNLQLQGLLFEPEKKTSKILVHVHGWVGNFYENSFLDPEIKCFLENGISVFTFNNRGAGIIMEFLRNNKRETIGGALEIFEECIYDIEASLDILKKRGYCEFILQAHSLGCQKIIYYLSKKKDKMIKCIVMLAPVDDIEYASQLFSKEKYKEALQIAKEMIRNKKGHEPVPKWMQYYPMLSANRFLQVSDPDSTSGRILYTNGKLTELKNIKIPMLAVFGSKDDYQKNPSEKLKILKAKTKCDTLLIKDATHWFAGNEKVFGEKISGWTKKIL